jgi:hypothetical protein
MERSSVNQRGSRENWLGRWQPPPSPDGDLPKTSSAPAMDSPRLHSGEVLQVRGSGEGKEWATRQALREGLGFYSESLAWVHGATRRTRLEGVGSVSGRCCALSLGV